MISLMNKGSILTFCRITVTYAIQRSQGQERESQRGCVGAVTGGRENSTSFIHAIRIAQHAARTTGSYISLSPNSCEAFPSIVMYLRT